MFKLSQAMPKLTVPGQTPSRKGGRSRRRRKSRRKRRKRKTKRKKSRKKRRRSRRRRRGGVWGRRCDDNIRKRLDKLAEPANIDDIDKLIEDETILENLKCMAEVPYYTKKNMMDDSYEIYSKLRSRTDIDDDDNYENGD